MLTDEEIEIKKNTHRTAEANYEHNDCIRMAYEWLDAQVKTKRSRKNNIPLKHIIESWSGRYVSQSDVEVAAALHPDVLGRYPFYNISSRLTQPSIERLNHLGEAGKHNPIGNQYSPTTYSNIETSIK